MATRATTTSTTGDFDPPPHLLQRSRTLWSTGTRRKESLSEVRALSKTLNNEVVLNIGFEKSITNELNRLKKMKFTSAELEIIGDTVEFSNRKHEIIIFRILQEFLSNSVKYSEAKNLNIISTSPIDFHC